MPQYADPANDENPGDAPLAFRAYLPTWLGRNAYPTEVRYYCTDCGVDKSIRHRAVVENITDPDDLYDDGQPIECDTCGVSLAPVGGPR